MDFSINGVSIPLFLIFYKRYSHLQNTSMENQINDAIWYIKHKIQTPETSLKIIIEIIGELVNIKDII